MEWWKNIVVNDKNMLDHIMAGLIAAVEIIARKPRPAVETISYRLPVAERLPCRCDHVRHGGALQKTYRCKGVIAVAGVDAVHYRVQLLTNFIVFFEHVLLAVTGLRIERRDLHLEDAFAFPKVTQYKTAELVDRLAVAGRRCKLESIPDPTVGQTQADGKGLRLHPMFAQPFTDLFAHV